MYWWSVSGTACVAGGGLGWWSAPGPVTVIVVSSTRTLNIVIMSTTSLAVSVASVGHFDCCSVVLSASLTVHGVSTGGTGMLTGMLLNAPPT